MTDESNSETPIETPATPVTETPTETPATTEPAEGLITAKEETPIEETPTELTDEQKAEAEAKAEADAQPITAETLTVPEGVTFEGEAADKFLELVNDKDMSPIDRANALLDLQKDSLYALAEQAQTAWKEQRETWAQEVRDDPTIGGEKLDKNLGTITKLLNGYEGKEAFGNLLEQTNLDNNVEMVRFLLWASKGLTEGDTVRGGPATTDKSRADIMFDSKS